MATAKTPKPAAAGKTAASKPGTAVAVKPQGGRAVVDISAIQAKLREQAQGMAARTAPPTGNKIMPTPGGFKLPSGDKVPDIKGVIVDFVTFHAFYEGVFDPKNIVPPGCFAVGSNPKDMAPTDKSPNLQAENCQVCPMNEFGSAGEGKACKNGRRLALLPLNDAGDDVDAEADLLILDVSPTAIKGFDKYVADLSRLYQLPPIGFITDITLDANVEYAKVQFSNPQPLPGIAAAFERQAEATELLRTLPDFSGWVNPNAPKGKAPAPAKKAAAGARR